jgi:hypothetical protein
LITLPDNSTCKSNKISKNLNPEFNYTCEFNIINLPEQEINKLNEILIEIYDEDTSNSND